MRRRRGGGLGSIGGEGKRGVNLQHSLLAILGKVQKRDCDPASLLANKFSPLCSRDSQGIPRYSVQDHNLYQGPAYAVIITTFLLPRYRHSLCLRGVGRCIRRAGAPFARFAEASQYE